MLSNFYNYYLAGAPNKDAAPNQNTENSANKLEET